MSEKVPEPYVPPSTPATGDGPNNGLFGLALFALFLLLFAGTVAVALVYLLLD